VKRLVVILALTLSACGAGGSPPPAAFSAAHNTPLPWRLEPVTVYGIPAGVTVRVGEAP
jgi:hypothetical protein